MINKIITSEGNVQFIYGDSGKIINVHPFHVYTVFNVDTVSFLLIAMPKDSGLAIFTTKAEDLEINGETYTFEELPNALSEAFAIAGAQARAEIVDELPETGMTNTIYLVPKEDGHGYDEYIYIKETGTWELIGDTDIELSRYVKKTDFNAYTAQTAAKIDYLSGATDAEVARATAAESGLSDAIAAEEARAIAAENEKTVTISLPQAEYDALPSSAKTDATKLYVISDAQPIDLSVYAKVSALTAEESARITADSFISGAVDTLSTALANEVQRAQNAESGLSEDIEDEMTRAMVIEDALQDAIDAVSGNVETETARAEAAESDLDDKIDAVSAATDDALALKQDTLIAGRGISITTGETADTVSFSLPISAGTGINSIAEGKDTTASGNNSHAEGDGTTASGSYSHAEGGSTNASGSYSHAEGGSTNASGTFSHAEGGYTKAGGYYSHAEGNCTIANNQSEHASGQYNVSSKANTTFGDSGNTLFSVGNGTSDSARHNAFEVRQNGDIYLSSGGTGIKLQDHLGGGGTVDQTIISGSTNAVAGGAVYDKFDEVEQVTARALNNLAEADEVAARALVDLDDRFGGLKLVKLTQSEYDNLQTKDSNTLYVIVN
jgi:hypothetical protein